MLDALLRVAGAELIASDRGAQDLEVEVFAEAEALRERRKVHVVVSAAGGDHLALAWAGAEVKANRCQKNHKSADVASDGGCAPGGYTIRSWSP